MKTPKVSVLIPVYNTEKYIRGCLQSVVDQTLKDIEVIAVIDGSEDGSEAIVDEFVSRYPHIRKINQPNRGLSVARNVAVKEAAGEYIAFLDGDDFADPSMYKKLHMAAKENNADIVKCGIVEFTEPALKLRRRIIHASGQGVSRNKTELMKRYLNWRVSSVVWDAIYHRSIVEGVTSPPGINYDDMYVTPEYILKSNRILHLPECLVYYIRRDGSITNTIKLSDCNSWLSAADHQRSLMLEAGIYEHLQREFHQRVFYEIIRYTLTIRGNLEFDLSEQHPAPGVLSEELLSELMETDWLSRDQKNLLKRLFGSFKEFCLHERYYAYKTGKINLLNLIGSLLKIKIPGMNVNTKYANIVNHKPGRSQKYAGFNKHEISVVQRYALS